MKAIDIFYQGEGIREVEHIEVGPDDTFGALKAKLIEKHGLGNEVLIFLEDEECAVDEIIIIKEHVRSHGVKIHVHKCRHVEAYVSFGGETVQHRFAPGTTVARVKHWAAVKKFGMSEEDAGEHMLHISGTEERPKPGTHLGALAKCPNCEVRFNLVPDQRVNGHAKAAK